MRLERGLEPRVRFGLFGSHLGLGHHPHDVLEREARKRRFVSQSRFGLLVNLVLNGGRRT